MVQEASVLISNEVHQSLAQIVDNVSSISAQRQHILPGDKRLMPVEDSGKTLASMSSALSLSGASPSQGFMLHHQSNA